MPSDPLEYMIAIDDKAKVVLVKEREKKLEHYKDITTSDGKTFVGTTNEFREDSGNGIKLNQPILIAGFPGPGLVGLLALITLSIN